MANFSYLNRVIAHLQKTLPSLLTIPPLQLRSLVTLILQQKSYEIIQESVNTYYLIFMHCSFEYFYSFIQLIQQGERLSAQEQQTRRQLIAATADAFAALAAATYAGPGTSGPSPTNPPTASTASSLVTEEIFTLDEVATGITFFIYFLY